MIPTTGATADLAALIGSRYGSPAGAASGCPTCAGSTLAGVGDRAPVFDESIGASSLYISVANLPAHSPPLNDPGHEHPQAGPYAYIMPWQFHNNRHPVPSNQSLEHIYTEPSELQQAAPDRHLDRQHRCESDPISMYQPTHVVNLYVKL